MAQGRRIHNGKPTFLLTTSATRRQYRKRTLRPEGATYGPPTNPCVPYKSLAKADNLPCVSAAAGHSLHCVSEEYRHCLRGEWHCLDEVRMPKVIHAPSSQGNSNCYSPHSTYTLLPPSLHELSQRDTGTQGMTMTVIKVLARISSWLFLVCQGIITRKRLYVMQPHSLLSMVAEVGCQKEYLRHAKASEPRFAVDILFASPHLPVTAQVRFYTRKSEHDRLTNICYD